MGGPVYRYENLPNSDREWPAYYDGKAMLGEWNQSKMYAMQVTADFRCSTRCSGTGTTVQPRGATRWRS